jgi:hypothetical protein
MAMVDVIINSRIRKSVNHIADRIVARQTVTRRDLDDLIRFLSRAAYYIMRKKDYNALRAFCGGLASALKRAGELSKIFEKETMVPINNLKKITSDVLSKSEEKIREEGFGIGDLTGNIRDSLNQLSAAITRKEIPKAARAVA